MKKIGILIILILTVFLVGCNEDSQLKDIVKVEVTYNGNAYVGEQVEDVLEKFIVHVYDSLGKKKQVLAKKEMISGFDTSSEKNVEVSVNYNGNVGVTIVKVVKASFLYADFHQEFDGILFEEDTLEEFLNKFTLAVFWNDKKQDRIKVTKEMISGFDVNEPGKKEVIVNYGGEKLKIGVEVLHLVDYDVTIDESITYFEYQPIEHFYEAFKIVGKYNNGEEREVEAKRINITATENIGKEDFDSIEFVFEKNGKKIEKIFEGQIVEIDYIDFHLRSTSVENRDYLLKAETYTVTIEYDTYHELGFNNEYMFKRGYIEDGDEILVKHVLTRDEVEIDVSSVNRIVFSIKGIENERDSFYLSYENHPFEYNIIDEFRYIKYTGTEPYLILPYSRVGLPGTAYVKNVLKKADYENYQFENIHISEYIDIIEDGAFKGSLNTIKNIYIGGNVNFDLEKIFGGVLPSDVVISRNIYSIGGF